MVHNQREVLYLGDGPEWARAKKACLADKLKTLGHHRATVQAVRANRNGPIENVRIRVICPNAQEFEKLLQTLERHCGL